MNLERGTVVANADSTPIEPVELFGPASFHGEDYVFYYYYYNIKDNVAKRIAAYKASH